MTDAHKALGGDAHKAEKLTRFYEARVASSPVRPLSDKTNQGAPAGILKKPSAVAVEPPAVPPSTPVTAALSLLSPAVSTPGGAAGAGTEGMASLTNISSLLVTLRAEREWLRSRIKRGEHERRATTAQLAQTEEQYKALAAKAETLRGRLGRQARVQAQAREQLGALDQKLRSISHTSVQFEEAVREIRGESAWGALAADGGVAVVASDDATLPDTPRRGSGAAAVTQPVCLRTLQAGAAALCVSIDSPQGLVGAAAADGTVRLWHLFSGRSAHTLAAHRGCARSLHVHGSLVLSGGGGGEVHVWQAASGAKAATLAGHTHAVSALQAGSRCAVSGSADRTLRQWDLATGKSILSLGTPCVPWAGLDMPAGAAATPPPIGSNMGGHGDGSGGADGHGAAVTCLQFWNWALASGSSDSTVKMWDLRTGACHRTLSGHVRRRAILAARNSLAAQFCRRAIL